jgi:hypothetical protein
MPNTKLKKKTLKQPLDTHEKSQALEKSLAQLLRDLKEQKLKDANSGYTNFETMNDGIKTLENIQFASVDDLQSVKEVIEIKQFFSKSTILNSFYFPEYKSLIHPVLLTFAELEVQLDTLDMKARDLAARGHDLASAEVKSVVFHLRDLNQWFFIQKNMDYKEYKARAIAILYESLPIFNQHRDCNYIIANIMIFILTVGTFFLINKALTGKFLFFKETDTTRQVNKICQMISNAHSLH